MISYSLDIDLIHGNIHDRSCKKSLFEQASVNLTKCGTISVGFEENPLCSKYGRIPSQLGVCDFSGISWHIQYIPRNMHTVFALLCFVVVIYWLIFPYPSGLLHWHCGNLTIAPVPAKQPWWIWINTSCEFIMNDCITTTKQNTTKPCAYFLGYTVYSVTRGDRCNYRLSYSQPKLLHTLGKAWKCTLHGCD